jgi:hypothetical protein
MNASKIQIIETLIEFKLLDQLNETLTNDPDAVVSWIVCESLPKNSHMMDCIFIASKATDKQRNDVINKLDLIWNKDDRAISTATLRIALRKLNLLKQINDLMDSLPPEDDFISIWEYTNKWPINITSDERIAHIFSSAKLTELDCYNLITELKNNYKIDL